MNNDNDLDDNIPGAGAPNLRESNPHLFGEEPAVSKLADLSKEELAAISKDDDEEGDDKPGKGDDASDVPERDETGRFVPRARIDELTAQRNKERDRAEAAEAKAAQLERERADAAEAERVAAEKKAKEVHDYDADRTALDAKYDANEIDQAEYRRLLRDIDKADRAQDRRLAEEAAVERVRKETQAERERADKQTAEDIARDAESASAAFLAKPENAAYKTDINRIAALNAQREIIYVERNGDISWAELLEEAKKRVESAYTPPKDKEETEAERVARERRAAQARVSAEASALPARPEGGKGARATAEPEDENDISPDEWRKLPKAERDKRLGKDGSGPKHRA